MMFLCCKNSAIICVVHCVNKLHRNLCVKSRGKRFGAPAVFTKTEYE